MIDGGNDLGWLDLVNKIMLECETSLVDNLGPSVTMQTLPKFHRNFGEIVSIYLFIKLANLPNSN